MYFWYFYLFFCCCNYHIATWTLNQYISKDFFFQWAKTWASNNINDLTQPKTHNPTKNTHKKKVKPIAAAIIFWQNQNNLNGCWMTQTIVQSKCLLWFLVFWCFYVFCDLVATYFTHKAHTQAMLTFLWIEKKNSTCDQQTRHKISKIKESIHNLNCNLCNKPSLFKMTIKLLWLNCGICKAVLKLPKLAINALLPSQFYFCFCFCFVT